jgi:hypothetical protein
MGNHVRFITMNQQQIKHNYETKADKRYGNYEPSADGLAWLFYPCDDHVIRARRESNGFWYAQLTTMQDRKATIDHAGPCKTRSEAVRKILVRALVS